ncbi:expressed unknown protein [Seminavis robusta]|uniref:Orc1-like AAA ATPase domain-containing protein n=1 Tax=Seminavis robusta TaxID=568900 RepID=A0A9N8DS86_9STRA|nr:expressed unknown protein [Seminavis robusta]|eukprot:Sro315_g115260.1 n/a (1127) ;mRNA; f:20914-24294
MSTEIPTDVRAPEFRFSVVDVHHGYDGEENPELVAKTAAWKPVTPSSTTGSCISPPRVPESCNATTACQCSALVDDDTTTTSFTNHSDDKLYGRRDEEARLQAAYQRCQSALRRPELTLITGESGKGKSCLAHSLRRRVEADHGFFVSGKFDQLERPETCYPLVRAASSLIEQLLERMTDTTTCTTACSCNQQQQHYQAIHQALQEIADTEPLLVDMIPSLRQFQTTTNSTTTTTGTHHTTSSADAPKIVALAFGRFLQAVCSPDVPLVFFLDDIQWAKAAPLEIVRELLMMNTTNENDNDNTTTTPGFMLLASCRGNEVPMEHHLSVLLRELETTSVAITDIRLDNLTLEAVNEMVRDQLTELVVSTETPVGTTRRLAQHIWEQTRGNTFFTIQLIQRIRHDHQQQTTVSVSSHDGAMITNNMQQYHYESALDLVTETILRLPKDVQEVLTIASCFGAEFHSVLLEELVDFDIREALEIAQDEQIIAKTTTTPTTATTSTSSSDSTDTTNQNTATYRFLHDQFQFAAFSLIPQQEQASMHLKIGRKLWNELNEAELASFGFAVVRQIRLGSHLLVDEGERYRVADLLLQAGVHATHTSAFDEAASHYELGISLLPTRRRCCWRDEYHITLQLYLRAAEVSYCIGNHERVEALTDMVLTNARNNKDKIGASITRMESLAATNQTKRALELALSVLAENGYRLPKKGSIANILFQLFKTKRKLKRYSNEQIRRMPTIDDGVTLDMMKIFNLAVVYSIYCEPLFFPIVTMVAVQTALKKGLCGASAVPYAAISMLLCCHFGEVDLGFRLGRLSLDIVDDTKALHWQPRVLVLVHTFVFLTRDSLTDQLAPLLTGHRRALANGDTEMAMTAAQLRSGIGLHASIPLKPLISDMKLYLRMMQAHGQTLSMQFLLPMLQSALNLVHGSENPAMLTGDIMDEEHVYVKYSKLMMACLFGDFALAETFARDVPNWPIVGFTVFIRVGIFLYAGVSLAAASSGSKRARLRSVRQYLGKLKSLVRSSEGRYDPQVCILEAEALGVRGETDAAVAKFQLAIDLARDQNLHAIVGLACERAWTILQQAGSCVEASKYLVQATEAFQKWGADAKVKQLAPSLPPECRQSFIEHLDVSQ